MTYGSLFSGIGGLDLAVEEVFGAKPAFHCEVDPNASRVLATHWPGVPNLGDITEVDWTQVPRVDILCGGFPCQDISSAGARAGIKEGTRSGLWFRYADAIRILRPRYVVVENVGALLVRGLDIVLGSLAEIGYDARWTCLRASDIGAPHQRNRLFLVAFPRDGEGQERGSDRSGRDRRPLGVAGGDPADTPHDRLAGGGPARGRGHGSTDDCEPSPDPSEPERRTEEQQGLGAPAGPAPEPGERSGPDWGPYEPAIRRWESLLRPAPSPVDERGRLSPWLTEWMMGLPHGWVAGLLPHGPALKACGNGVVPAQAVEALHRLLSLDIALNESGESISVKVLT